MKGIIAILILLLPTATFASASDPLSFTKDTLNEVKPLQYKREFNKLMSVIPPAVFVGYGFIALNNKLLRRVDQSVYEDMNKDFPEFTTNVDDYLQYAPAAAVSILNIAGIKGKHSFIDQTALYAISTGIMSVSVSFFKNNTNKVRPNGSSYTSFPSGHTATAFAAAEFLYQEYGDRSIWYGIVSYSAATATGVLRVYNNAHWFSDIIAGAGFGISSAKAAYVLYPHFKKLLPNIDRLHFKAMPSYQKGIIGISVNGKFG